MNEVLVETLSQILLYILGAILSGALTLLLLQLSKNAKFTHLQAALTALKEAAMDTAAALQQQFVEDWKAANADGKLTEAEKAQLAAKALDLTLIKMTPSAIELIKAAGMDVAQIVKDAVDKWVYENHKTKGES